MPPIATVLEARPSSGDASGTAGGDRAPLGRRAGSGVARRSVRRRPRAPRRFDARAYAEAHRPVRACDRAMGRGRRSRGVERSDAGPPSSDAPDKPPSLRATSLVRPAPLSKPCWTWSTRNGPTRRGLASCTSDWAAHSGRRVEIEDAIAAYTRSAELVPTEPPSEERASVLAGYAQILMLAARYSKSLAVRARGGGDGSSARQPAQIEGHAMTSEGMAPRRDRRFAAAGIAIQRESIAIAEEIGAVDDLGRAYSCLTNGDRC